MEPIKPKVETRAEVIKRRLQQPPWSDKASKLEPASASSAAQKSRSRSAGLKSRAASEPPQIKPKAESRAAAIKRRLTGKNMEARATSEPAATKASTRSRSRGGARNATEPAPAPRIRKGNRSPIQEEAKKTRRRSKSSPEVAPPETKAATAAYPPFWAPAAKVAAKVAAKAAKAPAAPVAAAAAAKATPAAPAAAVAKGPAARAEDMGPAIIYNNDRAYWQKQPLNLITDQLSQRGYRTELSNAAFKKQKKADFIQILISLPLPKQRA